MDLFDDESRTNHRRWSFPLLLNLVLLVVAWCVFYATLRTVHTDSMIGTSVWATVLTGVMLVGSVVAVAIGTRI